MAFRRAASAADDRRVQQWVGIQWGEGVQLLVGNAQRKAEVTGEVGGRTAQRGPAEEVRLQRICLA